MHDTFDVVVIGAGPAGLAAAIYAREKNLSVAVVDKRTPPIDKACGEGLMPSAVERLRKMGIVFSPVDASPITGICYVQGNTRAIGALPKPGGLGVRRLALSQALFDRAKSAGAVVLKDEVKSFAEGRVQLCENFLEARFVICADGLHSPARHRLGLDQHPLGTRFGLRRHYGRAPWSSLVEVHFGEGIEAYVTPAGEMRVGVAFLFAAKRFAHARFENLLARFPQLEEKLAAAPIDSSVRGLGPMHQVARFVTGKDFALLGDAAGYLDAITGEGISLALESAEALVQALPATPRSLKKYAHDFRRAYRRYAFFAGNVLRLAERPLLRRGAVFLLARVPGLFTLILRFFTLG